MTKDGVTDVTIPDSMLDNHDSIRDYYIYAFVYLRDDTSGETVRKIKIPVTARPKPEAWDKPEDAELFRDAIAVVNASADRAEGAVASAEALAGRFDGYVAQKTTDAEEAVITQQEASIQAVIAQQEASVQAVAEAVKQTGGGAKLLWSGALVGRMSSFDPHVEFTIPEECFFNGGKELILAINGFCGRWSKTPYALCVIGMCFGKLDDFGTDGMTYPNSYGNFQRYITRYESGGSQSVSYGIDGKIVIPLTVEKVTDTRYAVCTMYNSSDDFCITSVSAVVSK